MNCNSTTHATCSLTFIAYKYNKLQVFFATQKLSWKANCKTSFFFIVFGCFGCWNLMLWLMPLLFIYKMPYFYLNHLVSLLFFHFFVLHWLFNLWLSFSIFHWILFFRRCISFELLGWFQYWMNDTNRMFNECHKFVVNVHNL